MSYWKGNSDACPVCGLTYRRLRTGMTYSDVRMLLWVGDDDTTKWKYKRRHTVLGLWWSIKQGLWAEHLNICEKTRMYDEALERAASERAELKDVLHASDEELEEIISVANRDSLGEVPSVFYGEDDAEIPF